MGKRIQQATLQNLESRVLRFGFVGENIHTEAVIDCAEVLQDYPDADVVLRAIMPGENEIYEPEISVSGTDVIWVLTQAELDREGSGTMQLTFTDGTEVIKSGVGKFTVSRSL